MYERYCELRDSKKVKDSDVAKNTGITPSTFSDWKKGKSSPNADKLVKIAEYLGTTVEYLVTGSDPAIKTRGYDITEFEYQIILAYRKQETAAKEVVVRSLGLELPDHEAERGKKEA